MSGYQISQAAQATGLSVSALRFYEKEGVVVPERTPGGYRRYRPADIEDLRFLARAKRLGLTLSEISELLTLLREEDCGPVQTRMRQLVDHRITEAQQQIADLVEFTARLQGAASRLGMHTPPGACDDQCGCRTDPAHHTPSPTPVPLVGPAAFQVACSLEPDRVEDRTQTWKAAAAQAQDRRPLPNGTQLRFSRHVDIAALSRLAADEQTCCGFFTFHLGIHPHAVTLDVTGPPQAQSVIAAMFGPPTPHHPTTPAAHQSKDPTP